MFERLIGKTPMVRAEHNLYLKVECGNLTGSVKDRAALEMICDGERKGALKPGGVIVEATSGNMGISLAALAAGRGYGCIIVMPDSMSAERQMQIKAYGAEVVLTSGKLGMVGAVSRAEELASSMPGSWMPRQFENLSNADAHYQTTGPEVWNQTGGKVDIFVAGVGTGGTITGAGRYLREKNPQVTIVAVEPKESPLLSEGRVGLHGIQGIGPNFLPQLLDVSLISKVVQVSLAEAVDAARLLAKNGMLSGISSGAAYAAASALAEKEPEKTVVTLLPDSGLRYLSENLF